jgi:hypothetical protein
MVLTRRLGRRNWHVPLLCVLLEALQLRGQGDHDRHGVFQCAFGHHESCRVERGQHARKCCPNFCHGDGSSIGCFHARDTRRSEGYQARVDLPVRRTAKGSPRGRAVGRFHESERQLAQAHPEEPAPAEGDNAAVDSRGAQDCRYRVRSKDVRRRTPVWAGKQGLGRSRRTRRRSESGGSSRAAIPDFRRRCSRVS